LQIDFLKNNSQFSTLNLKKMVAKISSNNNLFGTLAYNRTKVEKDKAKVIFANRMIENKDGNFDMRSCMQSFQSCLPEKYRTEKPVLHVSLNPDPKDKLTDEQLAEAAQTYMQKMGYGNQPYIVFKHEDIEREHIHIVSLRVDENGKKINSAFERRRSMEVCRELEQAYGLVAADKKQRQDVLPLKKVDYEKGDIKHQLANVIRPISKEWYFQSFLEYKALLSIYNVGVEEVKTPKGKLYGDSRNLDVGYELSGLSYSALNNKGEKVGNPFNSSLFGKEAGLDALNRRYIKSKETVKGRGLKERSKKVISEAMLTCKTRPELEKVLEKQNISAIFRENEQGRIYGATFVDHQQRCIFNGSSLGKEFSANIFNNHFNSADLQDNQFNRKEDFVSFNHENQVNHENHGSDLSGFFDFFPSEGSLNDEIEEQKLTRLMKKKKKQQRRI